VRVGVFLVVMSVVVSMIMAAGGGVMGMIVTAGRVIMVVIVVVGNRMIVSVIVVVVVMPATATVGMSVVVVMTVIVIVIVIVSAVELGGFAGEQVEEAQDHEADTSDQDHGLEDAIGWEVIDDAARGVEVKQHAPPEEKQGDADVVSEGAGEVHGLFFWGDLVQGSEFLHEGDPGHTECTNQQEQTE
jgi:hypothetical protein